MDSESTDWRGGHSVGSGPAGLTPPNVVALVHSNPDCQRLPVQPIDQVAATGVCGKVDAKVRVDEENVAHGVVITTTTDGGWVWDRHLRSVLFRVKDGEADDAAVSVQREEWRRGSIRPARVRQQCRTDWRTAWFTPRAIGILVRSAQRHTSRQHQCAVKSVASSWHNNEATAIALGGSQRG